MRSINGSSLPLAALVVLGAACQPRPTTEAEEPDGPAPLCAVNRVTHERVEGSKLVVEVFETDICASQDRTRTIELARVDIEVSPSCPAGKVLLEVGGGERVLIPELAARLERRAMSELRSALANFAAANRNSYGKAIVVTCTDPKWLLVVGGNTEPRAQLYSVPPPPRAEPQPDDEGPIVPEPPPRDALVTGTCTESLDVGKTVWVGRAIATGLMSGPSSLTTWTLGRTGNQATLVIQELRAPKRGGPLADEQPEGTWACVRSTAWQGSVRGTPLRFTLSQGANGQQLELVCSKRSVTTAEAVARRIRVPPSDESCNTSRWAPAATRPMQVLSCVTVAADAVEPTPFFLASRPGVEHVTYDNDDCGKPATALRRIPRGGGIATAVKISEQPRAYVPAPPRPSR